ALVHLFDFIIALFFLLSIVLRRFLYGNKKLCYNPCYYSLTYCFNVKKTGYYYPAGIKIIKRNMILFDRT
ncbi:hypothetical protein, partial [Blautia wexlerae]|uniref:hypothetical protein n=1 Tax=Blautia wexlerae TaxID=418240 RepID=UPI00325C03DC